MSAIPLERSAVIAEPLRPRGLDVGRVAPPVIGLPPGDVVPDCVRLALEHYAADMSDVSRAQLVTAVDRAGEGWEHSIATRAVSTRAEFVDACRRVAELHDELVRIDAEARWLRAVPTWDPSWDVESYSLHVAGHEVTVPEILARDADASRDASCSRDADPRASSLILPLGRNSRLSVTCMSLSSSVGQRLEAEDVRRASYDLDGRSP